MTKLRLSAGVVFVAALSAIVLVAPASGAGRAGDIDRSFGQHGLRIVRQANDVARAVALGRKGRIVVAGGRTVARLRPNGRLDRSFADSGIATLGSPADVYGSGDAALAVGRKGGVFVARVYCTMDGRCGFAVSHLKRDGDVDRSFGENGTTRVAVPQPEASSPSIAIAHGGEPVVTGLTCRSHPRDCNLALARLTRHGRLDPSFGNGGKLIASVGPEGTCPARPGPYGPMALDSRGRIVMGVHCERVVTLARFEPNGQVDRSFGKRGMVNRHVRIFGTSALTIDPKNRIDVAGPRPQNRYGVARFRPSGKVDSSFGKHGTAAVRFDEKQVDVAFPVSAAVDSRGRIVLAGTAFGFSFARFTAHGHVDRHFGRRGHVVTGRSVVKGSSGQGLGGATSVAIDRRNRIVASGIQRKHRENHFAVVRLLG